MKKYLIYGLIIILVILGFWGWKAGWFMGQQSSDTGTQTNFEYRGFVRSVDGMNIFVGGPQGNLELNTDAGTKILRPISQNSDGSLNYSTSTVKLKELFKGLELSVILDKTATSGIVVATDIKQISFAIVFNVSSTYVINKNPKATSTKK